MTDFKIERFPLLDSTSSYLKRLADEGAEEGLVIVADAQTKGRGRRGKSFFSPEGTGLYMSFLLRPKIPADETLFITTATATALSLAIEELYKKSALIKWVNDVYVDGKKVAGILTEASFSGKGELDYVVVGVGVNLTTKFFPDEIKDIATSLGEDKKEELLSLFLSEFSKIYEAFPSRDYFKEYKRRSFIIGMEIEILGEEKRFGKALDIDDDCRLEVMLENGEKVFLSSGEVSTKLKKIR